METKVKDLKPSIKENKSTNVSKEKVTGAIVEKTTTKLNDILNPTAEGRIKKMQNMLILADKHEFLQKKKDELEKFILSSDGTQEKITLSNAKGFSLDISNSQVVEEVTEVVTKIIERFLSESEKTILNYSI